MRPVTRVLLRTSWTMSTWSKTSLKAEKEKWRGSPASCGINARNNVHTTGPRVKKAATQRMTSVPRLAGSRRRRGAAGGARAGSGVVTAMRFSSSLVEDVAAAESELEGGDGEDQCGEHDADRRGAAELQFLEAGLVDHHHGGAGRVAGAAAGQDPGLVEDLQCRDHGHHGRHEHCRPHERQGDLAEARPAFSQVELCGLVDLARIKPKAAEEQQEREPEA